MPLCNATAIPLVAVSFGKFVSHSNLSFYMIDNLLSSILSIRLDKDNNLFALLHNADRTACMNDKTMREVNNRLSNKQFSGSGGDISCRSYLTKMSGLLHGKFNPDAAYQIMQATTKGKPHQFLSDASKPKFMCI